VVNNYTVELALRGLRLISIEAKSGPAALLLLRDEGVVSEDMRKRLVAVNQTRNEAPHDYEVVRAAAIYDAARDQDALLEPFLSAYVRWLDELGFGRAR